MIDLHMHSRESIDGELPPETLIAMARDAGLTHIAITDHNSAGAAGPALAAARRAGITVIPGIELDCVFAGVELHVLGYGIDHGDKRFADVAADFVGQHAAASRLRMDRVEAMGIAVDREAAARAARQGVVTAELIAEVCLADPGNAGNPLLAPLRPGGPRSDNPFVNFYWDFCSQGKPAHVSIAFMSLPDCIALIRDTGGVPVLAHPGQSLRKHPALFHDIVREGIMGVEAYSGYHAPEACRFWREQADGYGLAPTCGSDFHGKTKPSIMLGGHGASAEAMRECYDALMAICSKSTGM